MHAPTAPYRVCVAGGRDFDNYPALKAALETLLATLPPGKKGARLVIVSGGATGADRLGERFAKEHGLALEVYPADWSAHGRYAGPIRNAEMARISDELAAFWNGRSRGTRHMIRQMRLLGKPVAVFDYQGRPRPAAEPLSLPGMGGKAGAAAT